MGKINILAASQFFGFGPTSELFTITKTLHDSSPGKYHVTILSNIHVETLRKEIEDCPDTTIIALDDTKPFFEELNRLTDQNTFDIIFSSYEPSVVYFGWYKNIPVVHYDGLYHFWDIRDYEQNGAEYQKKMRAIRQSQNLTELEAWYFSTLQQKPHSILFGSHFYASLNMIRGNEGVEERLSRFASKKHPTIQVSNIIRSAEKEPVPFHRRSGYVVMIGGSLNPIIPLQENIRYARWCIQLIEYMSELDHFRTDIFTVLLHPKVYDNLLIVSSSDRVRVQKTVQQKEYFHLLRNAKGLFTPPSHTSVPEALYFYTPVFILPEQNGGQPSLYEALITHGYPSTVDFTLTGNLHNGKAVYGEYDMKQMYSDIESFVRKQVVSKNTKIVSAIAETVTREDVYKTIVTYQRKAITAIQGNFTGAEEIVTALTHFAENLPASS